MSSKISLKTNIKLNHSDLDNHYEQKILDNSKEKLKNTTSKEGYILDVLDVEKIFGNKIKNNSVVFDVLLNTLCIKLEKRCLNIRKGFYVISAWCIRRITYY